VSLPIVPLSYDSVNDPLNGRPGAPTETGLWCRGSAGRWALIRRCTLPEAGAWLDAYRLDHNGSGLEFILSQTQPRT
jgi:hypothetical protein